MNELLAEKFFCMKFIVIATNDEHWELFFQLKFVSFHHLCILTTLSFVGGLCRSFCTICSHHYSSLECSVFIRECISFSWKFKIQQQTTNEDDYPVWGVGINSNTNTFHSRQKLIPSTLSVSRFGSSFNYSYHFLSVIFQRSRWRIIYCCRNCNRTQYSFVLIERL